MSNHSPPYFPDETAETRRIIVVLPPHKIEKLYYDRSFKYKKSRLSINNSRVTCLMGIFTPEVDNMISANPVLQRLMQNLRRKSLIDDETVLIQDPYDPLSYHEANNAFLKFVEAKWDHFGKACSLLGVSKIETEVDNVRKIYRSFGFRLKAFLTLNYLQKKYNEHYKEEIKVKLKKDIGFKDIKKKDIAAAQHYVESNFLQDDDDIKDLMFFARNRDLDHYHREIDLSKQSRHTLMIASKLFFPGQLTSINAKIEDLREELHEFKLSASFKW